ncbi:MAG TPA: hypothetical protein VFT45_00765, partial [Longimicrobium sp.]|nr:hypothetical protein [Longimicrobium sp.]
MPSFLKQYGERRTGTNYLRFLVQANFQDVAVLMHVLGDKHGPPSPFDALWRQAQCCADPAREFVWRATFEPPWRALADEAGRREVVRLAAPVAAAFAAGELGFLLSVKNPYAWALSLRRFLRWPAPAPARLARACQRFNEVHGAWLELSRQRPCCVVRHEDLVDDPEGVLRTVGARFGLRRRDAALEDAHERMSAQFWDDTPIETTGEPFDRGYYRDHRYLQELGAAERDVVTRAIDWSLLEPFGYAPEPPAPAAGAVPRPARAPAARTQTLAEFRGRHAG